MPKKLTTDGQWQPLDPFEALSEGDDGAASLDAVRLLLNRFAEELDEETDNAS